MTLTGTFTGTLLFLLAGLHGLNTTEQVLVKDHVEIVGVSIPASDFSGSVVAEIQGVDTAWYPATILEPDTKNLYTSWPLHGRPACFGVLGVNLPTGFLLVRLRVTVYTTGTVMPKFKPTTLTPPAGKTLREHLCDP